MLYCMIELSTLIVNIAIQYFFPVSIHVLVISEIDAFEWCSSTVKCTLINGSGSSHIKMLKFEVVFISISWNSRVPIRMLNQWNVCEKCNMSSYFNNSVFFCLFSVNSFFSFPIPILNGRNSLFAHFILPRGVIFNLNSNLARAKCGFSFGNISILRAYKHFPFFTFYHHFTLIVFRPIAICNWTNKNKK